MKLKQACFSRLNPNTGQAERGMLVDAEALADLAATLDEQMANGMAWRVTDLPKPYNALIRIATLAGTEFYILIEEEIAP